MTELLVYETFIHNEKDVSYNIKISENFSMFIWL